MQHKRLIIVAVAIVLRAGVAPAQQVAEAEGPGFKGWVSWKTTTPGGDSEWHTWNSETGAVGEGMITAGKVEFVEYKNPATGEHASYNAKKVRVNGMQREMPAQVFLSALNPIEGEMMKMEARSSMTLPGLLAAARQIYGQDGLKVSEDMDRDMRRVRVEQTDPEARPEFPPGQGWRMFSLSVPGTVWLDPKTLLVQEAMAGRGDGARITITYDVPPIASIYDAGAPRDAKVVDFRPDARTIAVFERVMKRAHTPLPDGIVAIIQKREPKDKPASLSLEMHGLAGANWVARYYTVDDVEGFMKRVPREWTAETSEAFLRGVAGLIPVRQKRTDGKEAFAAEIDPVSGAEFRLSTLRIVNGRAQQQTKLPGTRREHPVVGRVDVSGPSTQIYQTAMEDGRYGIGNTLELISSPEDPQFAGMKRIVRFEVDNTVTNEMEYWFDPNHDDRPVRTIEKLFTTPGSPDVRQVRRTEYGSYATLPAPDGRSYPTTWTTVVTRADAAGKMAEIERLTTIFHFFPQQKLGGIPTRPEGLP